jgi:hypothetical protein
MAALRHSRAYQDANVSGLFLRLCNRGMRRGDEQSRCGGEQKCNRFTFDEMHDVSGYSGMHRHWITSSARTID